MFRNYLITGATGFLGRAVIAELMKTGAQIHALVLNGDPLKKELPGSVYIEYGDVCDIHSLKAFFEQADHNSCVIHCAGIISIETHPDPKIYAVNVNGTKNVLRCCEQKKVGKFIYVSSVHALPQKRQHEEITEKALFSPELVKGDYSKSKTIATASVFSAARHGLNACVVFPSGLIGPGDNGKGSTSSMLLSFLAGRLPFAVKGGYDFVDVRDVAKGIVSCTVAGIPGRGYILSGHYASIRDILTIAQQTNLRKHRVIYLPHLLAKIIAPLYELWSKATKSPVLFSSYAIKVLNSNCNFDKSSSRALNYFSRPLEQTIRDEVTWLKAMNPRIFQGNDADNEFNAEMYIASKKDKRR